MESTQEKLSLSSQGGCILLLEKKRKGGLFQEGFVPGQILDTWTATGQVLDSWQPLGSYHIRTLWRSGHFWVQAYHFCKTERSGIKACRISQKGRIQTCPVAAQESRTCPVAVETWVDLSRPGQWLKNDLSISCPRRQILPGIKILWCLSFPEMYTFLFFTKLYPFC